MVSPDVGRRLDFQFEIREHPRRSIRCPDSSRLKACLTTHSNSSLLGLHDAAIECMAFAIPLVMGCAIGLAPAAGVTHKIFYQDFMREKQ